MRLYNGLTQRATHIFTLNPNAIPFFPVPVLAKTRSASDSSQIVKFISYSFSDTSLVLMHNSPPTIPVGTRMDKCDSGLNANTKPFITVKNIDLNAAKGNLNKLGTNNNLSIRDIPALNPITYKAIPSNYHASASIIHNPSNNMLNPGAEVFSMVSTPLNTTINSYANVSSLDTIYTAHVLNPCAITFVPLRKPANRNYVITAILGILSFLFILLLIHLVTTTNHQSVGVNPKDLLKMLKYDNPNKIIIGHLNINSIRYKFEFLKELIGNNIDIFLISETKLNDTFPTGQFRINGYHVPLRLDRNDKGGGLLLYFRDHIPCKKIIIDFGPALEAIVIEINLKKRKWLLIGSYNPHKDTIRSHLNSIGNKLNELYVKYENFILIGDFNSEMHVEEMNVFSATYNLKNLVKEPTCYKNVDNPSCIDLILTNKPLYFQMTTAIETGISDFHKLTITTLKSNFIKQEPKIFNNRNFKRFKNENFRNDLLYEISRKGFHDISCEEFETLFMITLNNHAPMKIKYIRANNSPFMNNELSKAIMFRSRLRNKYFKCKTKDSRDAYKKQRNYCISRKED